MMAVKNKKKKKVTQKKDRPNINNLFRYFQKKLFLSSISKIGELNYSDDKLYEMFGLIKDSANALKMNEYKQIFNHNAYIKIVSCVEDCVLMYRMDAYSDDNFTKMKEHILEYLSTEGLGIEVIVSMLLIGYHINVNEEFIPVDKEFLTQVINAIKCLSLHLLTYITKLKNNVLCGLYTDEDNKLNIVYGKDALLSEDEFNLVNRLIVERIHPSKKSEALLASALTSLTNVAAALCSLYLNRNLSSDFIDGSEVDYFFVDDFKDTFPLKNNDFWSISEEELEKLPDNRLYATPKSGIRFEFLDKSKNIDHIDMTEDVKAVYFKVVVFNNNNMYKNFRDSAYDLERIDKKISSGNMDLIKSGSRFAVSVLTTAHKERTKVLDRTVELSFVFDKEKYSKLYNKDKEYFYMQAVGIRLSDSISTQNFIENIEKIMYCCLYMAYYNPGLCSNEVILRNIEKCKHSRYTKDETYRVAHLRKLPVGSTLSPQAIKNAMKEGFDYIPEGYTFVSASNIHLSKSKVIEII